MKVPAEKGSYATLSGTSMSSPHVAGAAALLLQAKPYTPSQAMRGILQNSAEPALWWGGLTVYAGIVVPLGARLFGSVEQGFLTQQVTVRLNVLGTIAATLLLAESVRRRFPRCLTVLTATACLLLFVQDGLWAWHAHLSQQLDADSMTVLPGADFYSEHRTYLWLTAVQWFLGLVAIWQRTPAHGPKA